MAQVIVSGELRYAMRRAKQLQLLGYHVVRKRHWSDGKWTFVMERR